MNPEIEQLRSERIDIQHLLPFKISPIDTGFDTGDVHPQEMEKIGQEIFQAWYQRQDLSRLEAVEVLRIPNPVTEQEKVRNLLIDSYLFAQRSIVHTNPKTTRELRLRSAIQDVQFQQAAVNFLLSTTNSELRESFWQDFTTNQESVNRPLSERRGAEKGIRATELVIRQLLSESWNIYFPEPAIDAVDKIDLVATRDNEIIFVQVKSSSNEVGRSQMKSALRHRQDKLDRFNDAVKHYADLSDTHIEGRIMTANIG